MIRLTADELGTLEEAWLTGSLVVVIEAVEEMVDAHRSQAVVMASLADDPVVRAVREGGL